MATKAYLASGMPFAWYRLIRPMQWITWRAISKIATVNVWPFILRFRHLDWCCSRNGYRKPCRSCSTTVSAQRSVDSLDSKLELRNSIHEDLENLVSKGSEIFSRNSKKEISRKMKTSYRKKSIALSKPTEKCAHKLDWFILHDGGGNWRKVEINWWSLIEVGGVTDDPLFASLT